MVESELVLGPYRVLGTLGQGGMSVVYRAEHLHTRSVVAVKTVPTPSQNLLAGLRREIHALTRIRHRGVVKIIAQGAHLGRPWYAMELLDGPTLRGYLQRVWAHELVPLADHDPSSTPTAVAPLTIELAAARAEGPGLGAGPIPVPLPLPNAPELRPRPSAAAGALAPTLSLLWRIFATVGYLHGEGIINCDLKPENILVVPGRGPVLIDFGLTSRFAGAGGRERLDPARGLSGTLVYMSPEQVRHDFVDARADLYALGCILYECIAGRPPFVGTSDQILLQHINDEPVPLSELVTGLPKELDLLVMKLLRKRLHDRMGYADDVASTIRDMSGDPDSVTDYPAPKPYLYRPDFCGREASVERILARIPRSSGQPGSVVLIGGESGSGKTRLAMEITKRVRRAGLRMVTSDCTPPSPSLTSGMANAPLYALRPLLQHIADRCQELGREFADAVLGPRGPILALYEPSFVHIPGQDVQPAPLRLSSSAAHRQLFRALADTITAFCARQAMLLVIDDLQWADELTLAFVRHLVFGAHLSPSFVLIVTYRTENAEVIPLDNQDSAQVLHLTLERMGLDAVSSIVSDMLALSTPPPAGSIEFLTRRSGGNPFFVSEYLRAGVEAGIIHRRRFQGWEISDLGAGASADAYDALPIPPSLQEVISQRLRSLSEAGRSLVELAAVFGREVDLALLLDALSMSERRASLLLDDLTSRQIMEHTETGTIRFVHEKLREVVYSEISGNEVRDLHRRAALAIEAAYGESAEAGRFWGSLGHHFSVAGFPEPAALYLGKAGDQARAGHANAEALEHYRRALGSVAEVRRGDPADPARWAALASQLAEAAADLLALSGRAEEARQTYETALGDRVARDGLGRARLLRKMGKVFENQHRHEESLEVYQQAEAALGPEPGSGSDAGADAGSDADADADAWRAEWFQLRSQQVFSNYWLARVPALEHLVAELTEKVERHENPRDRARLHQAEMHLSFRRERYMISADGVEHARAALNARLAAGDLSELPLAHFNFAFAMYLHEDYLSADWELQSALSAAERTGDVAHQARCLTYLTAVARRQQRIDDVRIRVARSRAVAESANMRDYIGAAHANLAWLAVREGDLIRGEEEARLALDVWGSLTYVFPFQWMALFPMMMAKLFQGDIVAAMTCIGASVRSPQQRLPEAVASILRAAQQAFDEGAIGRTSDLLHAGLDTFQQFGFL